MSYVRASGNGKNLTLVFTAFTVPSYGVKKMKTQIQLIQKLISVQRIVIFSTLAISIWFGNITCASGQGAYGGGGNSFFGTSPGAPNTGGGGGGGDSLEDSNPNAVLPGLNSTNPNTNPPMGTDFSGDEKRMQRKYKENLNSAKKLIDKGTQMMDSAGKDTNDPDYKKGKIFKETGEKWLVQLKANNPFAPAEQKK